MKTLSSLSSILPDYDALLLDLWGVIHDGTALYAGVLDVLKQLKTSRKRVIFLSNAPRRTERVADVLKALGVDNSLYEAVVSSGEVGYLELASQAEPNRTCYYYIGPQRDAGVLDGLGYIAVQHIASANFLLNVGFGSDDESIEDCSGILNAALQHNLPMICLNPDKEVVKITGERYACAGVIADAYAQLGGLVQWFGKPYPAVYIHCLERLSAVNKSRILVIGDGLDTDILGANRAGLTSVLVSGGILNGLSLPEIMALAAQKGAKPDYIIPAFSG